MNPQINITEVEIDGHQYQIKPHPPLQGGNKLAMKILAFGGVPLMNIIDTFVKQKGAMLKMDDLLDSNLEEVLSAVDFGAMGADASLILNQLADNPGLIADLFRHTTRDGKLLRAEEAYNEAFSGNYRESFKAMFEIIKVNGFLPFGSSSDD